MSARLTEDEVIKRFKELYNGEYELISEYIDSKHEIKIRHIPCGTEYTLHRIYSFFNGTGGRCPKCTKVVNSTKKVTEEEIINRTNSLYNGEYIYVGGFQGTQKKCFFKHIPCGSIIERIPNNFLGNLEHKRIPCQKCYTKKKGPNNPDYLQECLDNCSDGNEYEWLEEFKGNSRIKHKIRHKTCGYEYEVKPAYFKNGIRCPKCSRRKSKSETELLNYVKSIYNGKIEANNRSVINPYEIDIYLPEIKIGIEYNGLFWHNEDHVGKKYHADKMKRANDKGIRLIQFFDDEWINKKDIVKEMIRSRITERNEKSLYARNTTVREIGSSEGNEFLERTHIQGKCTASNFIGLYYGEELVSVAAFIKLRSSMNTKEIGNSWELVRFATSRNVTGGLMKEISFLKNLYNAQYIKTLADLIFSYRSHNM